VRSGGAFILSPASSVGELLCYSPQLTSPSSRQQWRDGKGDGDKRNQECSLPSHFLLPHETTLKLWRISSTASISGGRQHVGHAQRLVGLRL